MATITNASNGFRPGIRAERCGLLTGVPPLPVGSRRARRKETVEAISGRRSRGQRRASSPVRAASRPRPAAATRSRVAVLRPEGVRSRRPATERAGTAGEPTWRAGMDGSYRAAGVGSSDQTHLPAALRTFLLTLAVVDDLLAITIIALFYTADLTTGVAAPGSGATGDFRPAGAASNQFLVVPDAVGVRHLGVGAFLRGARHRRRCAPGVRRPGPGSEGAGQR